MLGYSFYSNLSFRVSIFIINLNISSQDLNYYSLWLCYCSKQISFELLTNIYYQNVRGIPKFVLCVLLGTILQPCSWLGFELGMNILSCLT